MGGKWRKIGKVLVGNWKSKTRTGNSEGVMKGFPHIRTSLVAPENNSIVYIFHARPIKCDE